MMLPWISLVPAEIVYWWIIPGLPTSRKLVAS